jgi:hypothetical protein
VLIQTFKSDDKWPQKYEDDLLKIFR